MLYYLGGILTEYFGPARLLQSYTVLIVLALYAGFFIVRYVMPSFYRFMPQNYCLSLQLFFILVFFLQSFNFFGDFQRRVSFAGAASNN